METNKFLESCLKTLDDAYEVLKHDESIDPGLQPWIDKACQSLKKPKQVLTGTLRVEMDDGSIKEIEAGRVLYNDVRGEGRGGIRGTDEVELATDKALALVMTVKNTRAKIPRGGAKGFIKTDPRKYSTKERERIMKAYAELTFNVMGRGKDGGAPDVNTTPQDMAWMAQRRIELGDKDIGVFTGKPLEFGGSQGRGTSTAQGGVYTLMEAARILGIPLEGAEVAVEGFGNAGENVAKILYDRGFKIVAVTDSKGGAYNTDGLDPYKVSEHKRKTKSVKDFAGSKNITNEELRKLKVKAYIPAALENAITGENAQYVQAPIILELANGPVTYEADRILHEKGILVISDFDANAGGVFVSYLEQVQNRRDKYSRAEEVDAELKANREASFREGHTASMKWDVNLRTTGYALTVLDIAKTMRVRGLA